MAKGRAVAIILEAPEKSELTALTRKHGAPQVLAGRARIVLAAADGLNNKEIASKVGVCAATVGTWRNRFAQRRMDGLYDEPRPGAPRQIGDDEIATTIRKTLETLPQRCDALEPADHGQGDRPRALDRASHMERLRTAAAPCRDLQALLPIRCSWRRCVTLLGSTCRRPSAPSCCALMRNPRSRRSIARNLCCRCDPARPNGAPTTTSGTERHRCSRRSM